MSLRRRVFFLCGAAILSIGSAGAQSSTSSSTRHPPAASESSSAATQLVADDNGALALPAANPGAAQEEAQQPGGWRHNAFRSLAFEAGAGANSPIGNDTPVITWGGNYTVGGGVHFSKRFSLLAEYQFIDDKLPGSLISDANAQGGNAHIWSLTLDPAIDLFPKRSNSVYVTGGGGFYRKLTSFTDPEEVEECFYYCGIFVENAVVGHFSSNQGGANVGLGFTHRLGGTYGDGNAKLYAEARYLFVNTPGINESDGLGTTELIPITLGVRW
jgi:hypothetical protein